MLVECIKISFFEYQNLPNELYTMNKFRIHHYKSLPIKPTVSGAHQKKANKGDIDK